MAALTGHPARVALVALASVLLGAAPPARAQVAAPPPAPPGDGETRELVVLVHGMGRSPISMWPLKKVLEREGYEVMGFGYSSYCCTIAEIGEDLRKELADRIGPQHTRIHFVGHSLGNIVIRYVLTRDSIPPRVGRVVMLAPPNQGAHAANVMAPWTGWLLKPTVELRADSSATVRKLPRVNGVEIGVIAARDDRTVKLPETHLDEETAHIVVGGGHSLIMRRDDVKQQVLAFIGTGRFAFGPGALVGLGSAPAR